MRSRSRWVDTRKSSGERASLFLEITTLVVLAIVLASKWATSRSSQSMALERAELENEYNKMRTDYNQLFEKRKASEEQVKTLDAEIADLKEALEETRVDLDDQIERNEDLGG